LSDPHARPPFRAIIRALQDSATLLFKTTPRTSFISVQEGWHKEIEDKLVEIREQEKVS
jgi:hypothetical protein